MQASVQARPTQHTPCKQHVAWPQPPAGSGHAHSSNGTCFMYTSCAGPSSICSAHSPLALSRAQQPVRQGGAAACPKSSGAPGGRQEARQQQQQQRPQAAQRHVQASWLARRAARSCTRVRTHPAPGMAWDPGIRHGCHVVQLIKALRVRTTITALSGQHTPCHHVLPQHANTCIATPPPLPC